MNLYTRRVKEKEFKGIIDSQLLKHSQEYRALATLRFLIPKKFDFLKRSEAPDLQDEDGNIGVEVTTAVRQNDMKAASLFCEYRHTNDEQRKKKLENKINETSSYVTTICSGIEVLERGGGLCEEGIYKDAIKSKIKKASKYRQDVKQLLLVVIISEIPSREAEGCFEKWTKDTVLENEYDEVYVISERFCIQINLIDQMTTFFKIEEKQNLSLKKIGRMTAENEIDLNCEEWL